ncbi:hypothetical protein [Paraburkholderia tropica]|uniref:hypothetical protein n=1 Tax=Paraburkholderia tropica TaxID=92647 RepID=UPI002AB2F607|nr:hypothetical protein [Paraburkholderia tropica]
MSGILSAAQPVNTTMHDSLVGGLKELSGNQQVTFREYQKYVLPADGYVFWFPSGAPDVVVEGSLHYIVQQSQEVDQSRGINNVIFTAQESCSALNSIGKDRLLIGTLPKGMDNQGADFKFAFNQRGSYYQTADLHHYTGTAVWPTMETQILESAADLPTSKILSNSIPLFMALAGPQGAGIQPSWLPNASYTVYPEYLAEENAAPPYIAVEIRNTESLQIQAYRYNRADGTAARDQLVKDTVALHLWGFNHIQATQYLDYLLWFFETYGGSVDSMGLMSEPFIRDSVAIQSELNTRSQKKVIELKVSYYQSAALVSSMKLIEQTTPFITVEAANATVNIEGKSVPPDPFPT